MARFVRLVQLQGLENHFEDHGDDDHGHDHGHGEVFGGALGEVLDHGSAEDCIAAIGTCTNHSFLFLLADTRS